MSAGTPGRAPDRLLCLPVDGIGEVTEGAELAALLAAATTLEDGDIPRGHQQGGQQGRGAGAHRPERDEVLAGETDRTVAWRGRTAIVRTPHGLVMAAAGVDASNTDPYTVRSAPPRPRRVRATAAEALARGIGRNVGVLVTDTAGRAWRTGQTDIAIGAAGLDVLQDYAGARTRTGTPSP